MLAAGALLIAAPAVSAAERIDVISAELQPAAESDGVELEAAFDFDLPWTLEDAVNGGVPLYFVVEFELYRSRWYWFDEKRIAATLTYRLNYSPLTRQYRLARGTLALPFEALGAALASLRRKHPFAELTFLTLAGNRELAERLGVFDRVIAIDIARGGWLAILARLAGLLRELRHHEFDVVYDFEFFTHFSAVVTMLTGAPIYLSTR